MIVLIDARMMGPEQRGIGRYIEGIIANIPASDRMIVRALVRPGQRIPGGITMIPVDARWYTFKEQWVVLRAILAARVDIVHIPHFNVPVGLSLLRLCGIGPKLIVTIHDLILIQQPREQATTLPPILWHFKYLAYRLTVRLVLRAAGAVIAVSEKTADEVRSLLPKRLHGKINTIPEGVSLHRYDPCPLDDQCPLKKEPPYLLTVGSCYPHKNLDWVFEALMALREKGINLHWVHIGLPEPSSEHFFRTITAQERQRFPNQESRIHTLGIVSDRQLCARYAHAMAFVYPSRSEGYGLPPLEALACGGRVLSSAIPSLEGIVAAPGQLRIVQTREQLTEAVEGCWHDRSTRYEPLQRVPRFEQATQETHQLYQDIYSLSKRHL